MFKNNNFAICWKILRKVTILIVMRNKLQVKKKPLKTMRTIRTGLLVGNVHNFDKMTLINGL